jgi:hypothetical protein
MPEDNTNARRRALLLDATQAAAEASRLIHEARDLNLPVEPGVRDGRDALVRWGGAAPRGDSVITGDRFRRAAGRCLNAVTVIPTESVLLCGADAAGGERSWVGPPDQGRSPSRPSGQAMESFRDPAATARGPSLGMM